jgi:hypothetical protein
MKRCYVPKTFSPAHRDVITKANQVCAAYRAQGYDLTLRQLYYQFVSRGWVENSDRSYKRLGSIVNDARLAGELDWSYIVDRTRNLRDLAHWDSPQAIMDAVASQYREDKWADQYHRVEVWVEKDALVGVLERICNELDVPYFSCRGYTSQSEIWGAAQRLQQHRRGGQEPVILHLGDHDPSGIDMTRDVTDRLALFLGREVEIRRLALNMDQVEQYDPPPNPAKLTDSRGSGYVELYGDSSWELDALEPEVLSSLIRDAVDELRDEEAWEESEAQERERTVVLQGIVDRWDDVADMVLGEASS